jgi:hypothetical protein
MLTKVGKGNRESDWNKEGKRVHPGSNRDAEVPLEIIRAGGQSPDMAKRKNSTVPKVSKPLAQLRGWLKRKPGETPFAEWWAEYKAEEKALEEGKFRRCLPCLASSRPAIHEFRELVAPDQVTRS